MSRLDKRFVLRHVRCAGCWRACRYRDFRGTLPVSPTGRAGPWPSYREAAEGRYWEAQAANAECRSEDVHLTRAGVLGRMHRAKQECWDRFTEACYLRDEDPLWDAETAMQYVLGLPGKGGLIALGYTKEEARAHHSPVSLREFWAWFLANRREPPDGSAVPF